MSTLKLFLFGSPHLERDRTEVKIPRRKALALLIYLAATGKTHARDNLATLFWPDSSQSEARMALSRHLSELNKVLGEAMLALEKETIALHGDLWLDVAEFEATLVAHPQATASNLPTLQAAVALYTDDFLAGFTLPDCLDFDSWQFFQVERLRQHLSSALRKVASAQAEGGDFEQAIVTARHWLALDSLHEPAQRALMQLYAQSGQQAAALRQYQLCRQILADELGVAPDAETTSLYERIRSGALRSSAREQAQAEDLSSPSAAPSENRPLVQSLQREPHPKDSRFQAQTQAEGSTSVTRHNLPPQPTPFVGRVRELTELADWLAQPDRRLVTILGPGGMGKSRLALETGQRLLDQFRDGVWFLALGAVDADSFSPALNPLLVGLAEILGLTLHGRSPPEAQVLAYLQDRHLLLIFDNLEHLVDSSEVISRLLGGTQGIKALVTSRKRLNLQEEWLFSLSGLALAAEPGATAQTQANVTEAVQLFQQVAQRVQPTFNLNVNFSAVEQICRLVEGMPLGIELAASWSRYLSPAAIAQEVENDIDFLATNVRNLPARHRSLRAVFDHSWRLLSPLEQAVLPQLAVFRGGFRHTEAQAIAGASLHTLAALVDKSLLSVSATGRYGLHERLRQYLLEKLRQDVAVYQTTRARHSQVYLALLHIDLAALTKKAVLDVITAEIDNLHAAWNWALDQAQWSAIRRSRSGLGWFYYHKGWLLASNDLFAQAVSTLKQRLATPETLPEPGAEAEMHCLLAVLQCYHWEIQARLGLQNLDAKAIVQKSLATLRALGAPARHELADCLLTAGQPLARRITVDHATECHYLQESLTLFQQLDNAWGQCEPLAALSYVALRQGHLAAAENYSRQLFLLAESTGNLFHLGLFSYLQGHITQARGQYAQAERHYQDAYQHLIAINSQNAVLVLVCNGLADVARLQEAYDQAIAYLQQAERLTRTMGFGHPADARRHETLLFFGYLAEDQGDTLTAQQQFEEVQRQVREPSNLSAAALIGLGRVALQEGARQTALDHFATALRLIPQLQTAPQALEALAGVAHYQAQAGQLEQALALVGLVLSHSSSTQETKDRVAELVADWRAALPPKQVQTAFVRGQTSELWVTVATVATWVSDSIDFDPAA